MKLFWSQQGVINCETHAPYKGSDSWAFHAWQEMSEDARQRWAGFMGKPPECEVNRGCGDRPSTVGKPTGAAGMSERGGR